MKLVCKDCGKRYDYEKDEFCPKCGSYNQPKETSVSALEAELEGRFASHRAKQTEMPTRYRTKTAARSSREDTAYTAMPERFSSAVRRGVPPKAAPRPTLRDVRADLKDMVQDLSGRSSEREPKHTPPPKPESGARPKFTPREKQRQDSSTPAAIIFFIFILINLLRFLFRTL